jgi:hypothetical protein
MDTTFLSIKDCPEVNSDEWLSLQNIPYRQCVGRLTYLMRTSRPDISFAVSVVNRFLHNPGTAHWNAVKRILRYLKGTLDYELKIAPLDFTNQSPFCDRSSSTTFLKLTGNVDADWGGENDTFKSTSGYCFFLGSSLISWSAKAQSTTATSSTYAEYIAAYHATAECIWIRSLLTELQLLDSTSATQIYCDNEPAIKIAQFHMITPRSKHFDTKYHFVREQVEQNVIQLTHCPGKDNVADLLTKPLSKNKFGLYSKQLSLVPRSQCDKVNKAPHSAPPTNLPLTSGN